MRGRCGESGGLRGLLRHPIRRRPAGRHGEDLQGGVQQGHVPHLLRGRTSGPSGQYQERFDVLTTLENRLSAGFDDLLDKFAAQQEKNKGVRDSCTT